jgi:IPT/TIG domain
LPFATKASSGDTPGGDAITNLGGTTAVNFVSASASFVINSATSIITGTNLLGTTAVYFGQYGTTDLTVDSDTSITLFTPAQPAGIVVVTVETYSGVSTPSSADEFTYSAAPAPVVLFRP